MSPIQRFLRDEGGATAIEYGMLCSMVVITILAAVNEFTSETVLLWQTIANHV